MNFDSALRCYSPPLAMSYNQSFTPQSGQGNLSAQFGAGQYRPNNGGSAPKDIPGRPHRQSSVSGSYPQRHDYEMTQPGGYGTSPSMAYSPHSQSYATSPGQRHLGAPPNQTPHYGSPSAQHYGPYDASPQHRHSMAAGSYPGPGWQQPRPQYGPSSYPPPILHHSGMEHRRKSSGSSYSHHSSDSSDRPKKSKRKTSVPSRYDSPRRPTMTDSVLAAWSGLRGAFDSRK